VAVRTPEAVRTPQMPRLPQPGWRLLGFASIGLGSGLFTADAPLILLAAAFVPALIALVVITAQATAASPIAERAGGPAEENPVRR
jgi:hypothetical protein